VVRPHNPTSQKPGWWWFCLIREAWTGLKSRRLLWHAYIILCRVKPGSTPPPF
jgi:hypothetical protein